MVWAALSQQLSPQVLVDAHMLSPRPSSQPLTRPKRDPAAQELPGQLAQSLDPQAWPSGGCSLTHRPGAGNSKWRPSRKKGPAVATAPGLVKGVGTSKPPALVLIPRAATMMTSGGKRDSTQRTKWRLWRRRKAAEGLGGPVPARGRRGGDVRKQGLESLHSW